MNSPIQDLGEFSRISLLEGAATLMLWPGNADRHAALHQLVDALAAAPADGTGRAMEAEDWAAWLASDDAKVLQEARRDGIHDAPLAVETVLLGHRKALLGGNLDHPGLQYRLWLEALNGTSDPDLEAALMLLMTAATICDLVVETGGLGSTKWPNHPEPGAPVAAPPAEEFERLRGALRMKGDDARIALVLEPLIRTESLGPWQPLEPIAESKLLLADPWRLSLSALVQAVSRATRSPQFNEVVARLEQAALRAAATAAEEMGWTVERMEADHLVARPDLDCLVIVGVGVVCPASEEFAEEAHSDQGYLRERWEQLAGRARARGADHSLLALISDGRGMLLEADHPCLGAEHELDPWIASVGELEVMGEALRDDPLALPSALGRIPRPPWPENHRLLDQLGLYRQWEESGIEERPSSDGTEHMLCRARLNAMRHPALLPDASRWVEVTRWEGGGDAMMFRARTHDFEEPEGFALLARASGRMIWITCPGTLEQRFDLLPVIATALAFWVTRLCKGGLMLAHSLQAEVLICLQLEIDRRPGPHLALSHAESAIKMVLGPGFIDSFCRGDNESDRMLAGALLAWAKRVGDPVPDSLLDEVLPRGRGTFAIWPDPEVTSNEPRLELLPPVEPRARREVELELASGTVGSEQILVASDESLEPVLEHLARTLEMGIQAKLDSLAPSGLRELVLMHERACMESVSQAVLLPALHLWRSTDGLPLVGEDDPHRELVLRVLIERASASHSAGEAPMSRSTMSWLRAATELQLKLRGALDAVRFEGAGGQVVVSPYLGVKPSLGGELPDASAALIEQVLAAAPDLMLDQHKEWWDGEPVLTPDPAVDVPIELDGNWGRLDLLMREEWGVGMEQMTRILRALSDMAGEQPDCVVHATLASLKQDLAERTRVPTEAVAAAIDRLTLGPCPEFDTFSEADEPGRRNRERSYLRRPLVLLPDDKLGWSSLHCLRAGEYLGGLIESGRLRGSPRLEKLVTWISQDLDSAFEDQVLDEVKQCGWEAKVRVTQLAGKPLQRSAREQIGDIDVLAWAPERCEVWLLDAKRLSPGVAPGPMLREAEVFEKYVSRHEERLHWVREHLPELAREVDVDDVSRWTIRAALVLNQPLAGAHLRQLSMPIWTRWGLAAELGPAGV